MEKARNGGDIETIRKQLGESAAMIFEKYRDLQKEKLKARDNTQRRDRMRSGLTSYILGHSDDFQELIFSKQLSPVEINGLISLGAEPDTFFINKESPWGKLINEKIFNRKGELPELVQMSLMLHLSRS